MDYQLLRELFRNLQSWESLAEQGGLWSIPDPTGGSHFLPDIQYLYSCRSLLSPRQSQAIELCLYENHREKDVAEMMGLSERSPVAIYAAQGLRRLCQMIENGEIARYGAARGSSAPHEPEPPMTRAGSRALQYALAGFSVTPVWWLDGAARCQCGRPACGHPGQHPVLRGWRDTATTSESTISRWWRSWPLARIGIIFPSLGAPALGADLMTLIPGRSAA